MAAAAPAAGGGLDVAHAPRDQLRLSPRAYQLSVFEHAKGGNVIAVLPTGSGKTLISCLLVKHSLDGARSSPEAPKLVFFLVNLVPLVFQQSDVLRRHCDSHVKSYCGEMGVDSWNAEQWERNLGEAQVHCMTAAIFLNIVSCGFVKMKDIALIILDECHHAKRKHPYAVIFDTYYRSTPPEERPRVFGMTASPIVGKQDIQAGLLQLQNALNCRVITCDESEISAYVSRAAERIVWYPPEQTMSSFPLYEEFCKWSARLDALYPESTGSGQPPKMFRKIATDTGDIIVSLGTAAADAFLRDTIPELKKWARRWKTKSKGKMMVLDEGFRLIEPSFLEPTPPELLTDSAKVRTLIAELRQQMEQPEYCGIIFVERRCTAWALGAILRREFGKTVGIIVGHGSGGALEESVGGQQMDYKLQNEVIRKFRKGEITTLVATSVAEEGLDIKPCMLVVRFDLPKTIISYIQSRGRARHHRSLYLLFAQRDSELDIRTLTDLKRHEINFDRQLNEGSAYLAEDTFIPPEIQEVLHNPETGAILPLALAVARLELFSSRFGGDRYYCPRPIYRFEEAETPGYFNCSVRIPSTNLPEDLRGWITVCRQGRAVAKAAAALAALRKLDANGYLDGHLLPPKPEPDQQVVAEIEEEQSFFAAALPELWSQASPWGSSLQDGPDVTYLNVIERSGKAQPIALLTRYAFPREIRVPLFVNGTNLEFFSVRTVWSGEIAKETLDVAAQWSALVWNTVLKQQEQSLNQVGDDDMTDPMDIEETRWASDMVIDVQPSKDPGSAAILLVALADDADWPIDLEKMRLHVGYAANPASLPELLARSEEADLLRMLPELVVEDTVGAHPSKYRILRKCEGLRPLEPLPNAKKPDTLVCSTYLKAHGLLAADVEPNQPVYIARRLPRKIDFLQPDRSKHQHPHAKNPQQAVPSPQNGESAQPEKRDSIFDGFIKSSDRLVFPQFLKVNPLENDIVNCAFVLPSVIEFLKLFLLAKEFNDRNDLFFGDKPEELVPAMTLARDSLVGLKESNLERLEFLGDAHIKAFVTMRTFVKDKMHMQGSLTRRRNFLVSNKYLGRKIVAMDPQWPSTIAAGKSVLKWREWRPPHVSRGSDEPLVELSIKAIADSVEAVAGACYLKDEKLADQWLSRVFLLDPEMPGREEAEAFILQQCGLAPGQDGTANLELHPKLTRVALVEDILGYKFRNKLLCLSALTHESAVDTTVRSYERLEFLGDAILSTLVTSYLFAEFSAASPGVLSALREVLVCNGLLAMLCVRLDLHIHLDHGSGALLHAIGEYLEDLAELDVHPPDSPVQDPDFAHLIPDPKLRWMSLQAPKALADMIESLLGAVFLDSGFDVHETERVFRGSLLPAAQKCYDPHRPPRHPVQMIVQVVLARRCQGLVFEYDPVARDDGSLDGTPTHFICRVMHHDVKLASASARSKKFARREAATRCLEELGAHGMRILEVAKCDCQESKKVGDEEDEEEGDEVVMKEFGLEGNERAKDLWEDLRDMEF